MKWARRIAWVVVVLLFVGACTVVLSPPAIITGYRLIDDKTLMVGLQTGAAIWVGVVTVDERSDRVVLSTREIDAPLPNTGTILHETTVQLKEPLAGREVIDAASGTTVDARP